MTEDNQKSKLPFLNKLGRPEISDLEIIKCTKCSNNIFIRCFKVGNYKKELIKSEYDASLFEIPVVPLVPLVDFIDFF